MTIKGIMIDIKKVAFYCICVFILLLLGFIIGSAYGTDKADRYRQQAQAVRDELTKNGGIIAELEKSNLDIAKRLAESNGWLEDARSRAENLGRRVEQLEKITFNFSTNINTTENTNRELDSVLEQSLIILRGLQEISE
jgi:hypothetical protein